VLYVCAYILRNILPTRRESCFGGNCHDRAADEKNR
jgi:hypothetical protein